MQRPFVFAVALVTACFREPDEDDAALPEDLTTGSAEADASSSSPTTPSTSTDASMTGVVPVSTSGSESTGEESTTGDSQDPGTTTAEVPDGCTLETFAEHDYLFCSNELDWIQARNACPEGMDLAIITTPEEHAWVGTLSDQSSGALGGWIGANDRAAEGDFAWLDDADNPFWRGGLTGGPVGDAFAGWAGTEPNNFGNEHCVVIRDPAPVWWDRPCATDTGYICEEL